MTNADREIFGVYRVSYANVPSAQFDLRRMGIAHRDRAA
jgi:hypothetical protein